MLHDNHSNTNVPSRAAAHTASTGGKSLPAPVIQRTPSDWTRSAKIAAAIQHQPGYFSTWKKIVAAINEYKVMKEFAYADRWKKLDLMVTLIGKWKEGHKDDKSERVEGIRSALPDLEELISDEREEIEFAHNTKQYATTGTRYVSKGREDVSFSVAKQGQKLRIISDNDKIAGNIEYDLTGRTISLKHFEAQPEGLGLGSVLMLEFAAFASEMGIEIVDVLTPAYSAMGAYEIFGGVPRAEKEEAFNERRGQYEDLMGLRNDVEHGEHIAEDHDDNTYNNFINEEAKAVGKTSANKAEFENPELGAEALEHISSEAELAHKEKNVRNVANVKRVARLKALSACLSYNIPALLNKTRGMVDRKWNIED